MMSVVAQLPGFRISDHEPLLVLGFDRTDALCVMRDGTIAYVGMGNLRVDWTFDEDAQLWTSTTSTLEDLDDDGEAPGTHPSLVDPV